ncbi:MAG TPA: FtsQ-type POTRA domain-containing protein [Candidatus Limnocylindria bacterium]
MRQRLFGRLPSIGRLLAAVAAAAAAAGLVALVNGPWLQVRTVAWEGGTYTLAADVDAVLADTRGRSVLAVDTRAVAARLEELPSVADAIVAASLTGEVRATLVEPRVALVWETSRGRFLAAADGTIFAVLPPDAELPASAATVPGVVDERSVGRRLHIGDEIPASVLETTLRVVAIDPAALGSTASGLAVRLDDEFGFRLVSAEAGWEVALGVYGTDPRETSAQAAARLESQVTAVRTLFASRPEAAIGWVDVRNPGKVYFRAKG